jgi:AcrR family transcriptional regulator
MAQPRSRNRKGTRGPVGAKRQEILDVATDFFGRQGYEDTKWADVAAAVGVGPTALYHYFESKQHCLYVIIDNAITTFCSRLEMITAAHDDYFEGLVAVLNDGFDLTEREVLRNRVTVAEQGLVSVHRSSPREEEAREAARARTRDLEYAWGMFLSRGMAQGSLPEGDPKLLTHAILGLYNSVWHWYRPGGTWKLDDIRAFFVGKQLAILGLDPALAERPAVTS